MKKNIKVWLILLSLVYSITPFAQPQPEIKVQKKHTGLLSVCFSPDDKYALSEGMDKTFSLWDIATGKEIRTFVGHTDRVMSICFSPDGKYALSGSTDKTLKLWEVSSGKEVRTFLGHEKQVYSICISHDGKYVLSGSLDGTLKLWDISKGKNIRTFKGDKLSLPTSVCFSPNGQYALSGKMSSLGGCAELWEIASGKLLLTFKGLSQLGTSVCFSPDGQNAISESADKTLKLWKISTGEVIKTFVGHKGDVRSVSFSPDGKYVLSVSDDFTVKLWDISTGREFRTFSGGFFSACLSSNGCIMLTGVLEGALKLWDISTGKVIRTFNGNSDAVLSVSFSSDGKYLNQGYGVTFNPWELKTGAIGENSENDQTFMKRLSSNGKYALSASPMMDKIFLEEVATSKKIRTFSGHVGGLNYVCFSPDGKYTLSAGGFNASTYKYDYSLTLWENSTGNEVRTFSGHKDMVNAVCFSSDGKYALSGSGKDYNSFAGIKGDYSLKLCEISTGRNLRTFSGHTNAVSTVCFSPDGKYVLSGSYDNTVKLWEVSSGKELKTFSGHTNNINSVLFSPNGKYAISGSGDNTIKIWDIESGELIYTYITNSKDNQWLAYDKEGYWDASPNGGSIVAMVQGMEVWNIDQFAVKNNRPDKILARLAETPPELIKHYHNQYLKRLKRLNLTEDKLSQGFETPETKITSTTQNGKKVTVSFTITSKTVRVARYCIFVNDVPVFGTYGKEIANTGNIDSKSLALSETIELTTGDNKIEISAMNENGAESFRAPTIVSYNPESPIKPDLYYLGFGVSKYKKAELNLQYADKDAKDLSKVFEKMKASGQFANVYSKTLLNEEVTPASIKLAKDFVKNAKPDDTFILFIAGHGTHDTDEEATYYFLTSNADPKNLKNTAADFETIEDLLQGIPPRNKLFLMDACESGEIDDEDQGQMLATATGVGISSRGFKKTSSVIASEAKQSVPKRTYLYQKDRYIYNDLVRRSGSIVYSSSKGGELSYERSDIQNGLFTKSIINALTTITADKNNDGIISTDELRDYVSSEVGKASGDLQHPVVDRDNIYQKFGFKVVK